MKGKAELIPGVPGLSPTEKEGAGQRTNDSPNWRPGQDEREDAQSVERVYDGREL
ncbi:hypothetical protein CYLTODRAFT_423143 [Cylindrobasidium torrendii FP15055 ss-10]|uniref:Uncharacterized protein n=1 Tax=Cylindrobasidium torrendii FP15055 ss-10 TaxID=1314674 RepID=A0A0D7B9D0_9AGAR|nr:hypothetical protein CYLTODRAFT_423143 [Cylindrobasidium torrendii FP15055 ss-10]